MITYTQARDALITKVKAALETALPSLPAFYENAVKVDTNTIGDQFIQVEVTFEESPFVTVDSSPTDLVSGVVGFRLYVKEGKGSRVSTTVFDALNTQLRHQTLSGVTTFSPVFGKKETAEGWVTYDFGFPFSYYSTN